jgi:hypothetical protein
MSDLTNAIDNMIADNMRLYVDLAVARVEIDQLKVKRSWIPVSVMPPFEPGGFTKPMLVTCHEFGGYPSLAIASAWVSSLHPNDLKWYLDRTFYHLPNLIEIVDAVTHWMPLPEPPDVRIAK